MFFLSKMSNLKQRLIISTIAIALTLLAIFFASNPLFRPIFVLLTAAVIILALWEYYHIAHGKGFRPLRTIGITHCLLYVFASFFATQLPSLHMLPEIVLALLLSASFAYLFFYGTDPFANIAITIFGFIYLTVPLSCMINITYYFPLESTQDGRFWLFYLLAVTKLTDTGAYFIGKRFGKTKMTPSISPNKTWEGAAGGLIVALLTSVLLYHIANFFFATPPFALGYFQSLMLGVAISLLAQFGDLAESLLKRDVGVKDSSQLPGLGGFLDVVDSLIFTSPMLYLFLVIQY